MTMDLSGKRFGRLTAIKKLENGGKKIRWLCQCDCGKIKSFDGYCLRKNRTKSCGCLRNELTAERNRKTTNPLAAINSLFYDYKCNASNRLLVFDISLSKFKTIIFQRCFYCGIEPSGIHRAGLHEIKYNGLDRIDSKKGYTVKNVVPCCKDCNFSKTDMSQDEFYAWIKRLYNNLKISKRID